MYVHRPNNLFVQQIVDLNEMGKKIFLFICFYDESEFFLLDKLRANRISHVPYVHAKLAMVMHY